MAKRPKRQNLKPPGKCIFCGGGGVTKEHLFADWLREIFPRTAKDTHTLGTIESWTPRPRLVQRIKQGHAGSRKIRKVCGSCNSGWIGIIDDAARKAVVPLIRGQAAVVDSGNQRALATWFSKIAMVGDSMRPDRSVVLQADRDWIRANSSPPLLWEVWVGSYEGIDWRDLGIFQLGGRLDLSSVTGPDKLAGYVETTTMGMGKLIGLVIGNEHPAIEINIGNAAYLLRRIWPTDSAFNWPLPIVLSDDEARSVAYILRSAIANPKPPA
jgi:hypothetical protein